jgi:lipopolysaccharide transport protein LptA
MKLSTSLLPLLAVLALAPWIPVAAQMDDANPETPPPAGSTVITSDELHSDQAAHTSIFTGKVVVIGTNFHLTCQEMTVYFTNDNKVDKIVATGDVVINQPDRITHCGHAEYYRDKDEFVLTDSPVILNGGKDEVHGTRIIIDRTSQKMTVDGGRSKVILNDQSLGPAATPTTSTDAK